MTVIEKENKLVAKNLRFIKEKVVEKLSACLAITD